MPKNSELALGPNPTIHQEQEHKTVSTTLRDLSITSLRRQDVFYRVCKEWPKHPERDNRTSFDLTLTASPPRVTIEDQTGRCHKVKKIELKAKASVKTTPITLQSARFMNVEVVHGTVVNIFAKDEGSPQEVHVTILLQEGKPPKAALMLPSRKEGEQVFSMQFMDNRKDDDGN